MSLGLGVGYYSLGGEDMASAVSTDLKQATSGTAAGLRLWLKNDTDVTAAQWKDSSGNDNHAAQSTEGNQAAVSGGGLDFEADNSHHYDLASSITIAENQGFCMAIVLTRESTSTQAVFSDSTNEQLSFQTGTTKFRLKANDPGNTTTDAAFATNTFAAGSKFLFLVNRSAGASNRFTFFKNGVALTADTDNSSNEAAGENPNGFDFDTLGATNSGSGNFMDGIIHELAFWNRSLTSQEITDVNSYLQSIHGL
jgi:hypothetical protein